LIVTAVSGFLGGTVRQVVWGVPLTTIPVIAWIRRDDKRVVSAGVLLSATVAAAVAISLFWLSRQAFFEWEPAPQGVDDLASVLQGLRRFAALIRTCLLLMLPVLIVYFFGWWRQRRWRIVIPGALVFGTAWIIVQFGFRGAGFPFGNLVTQEGVLRQGTEAIGSKPVILSGPLLAVLSFMTLAAATTCVVALLHSAVGARASSPSRQSMRRVVVLCAPFCAAYAAILLYRTMSGDVFDRYVLILLPVVNLPLLWLYQQRIRDKVPLAAWLMVGVFGVYGVATSHDYISSARARLAAASAVMADGAPRTSITAGMEFDGWTEIEAAGHVNSFLISTWSSTPPSRPYRERPGGVWFRFWGLTPSVDPKYFVVYSRQPGLTDTAYPPVSYSVWLPPATRSVYTQTIKP
jgi:hypothetical protein